MPNQLIHPSFKPVQQVTPQQAFEKAFRDIDHLGKLLNNLTNAVATLYERFYVLEQHLGISVVQQPAPEPPQSEAQIEVVSK